MLKYLFSAVIILNLTCVLGQSEENWTLYTSSNGVDVHYLEVDCTTDQAPAQTAYLIRITNRNSQDVTVEWDLAVWYNYEKLTHDVADGENHQTISLSENQIVMGDCNTPYGALYIFKDFITYVSPTKLTRFELENFTVRTN